MSEPLRVAVVHYHLKRGGVTRVVESTLRAAERHAPELRFAVLAGEVPEQLSSHAQAVAVPGLQYSNSQPHTPHPAELLTQLQAAAQQALGGPPDVWHIHNHSLGKNSSVPELVRLLAASGAALLLQLHDFAEDGRPGNYAAIDAPELLYPAADRLHYAAINARDHAYLQAMGLPPEQLHLLPNPVEGDEAQGAAAPAPDSSIAAELGAERLILYPVRAVRRKNFGELLLWAALAEPGDVFATTLGPTNPNYAAAYQQWQQLAQQLQLPVRFGIGESGQWSFPTIVQSAHAILSTSIAEGFGLAFLEPWLHGKPIVGRDLPAITADFKAHGLQLDSLYPALGVPADWIDQPALEAQLDAGLQRAYQTYRQPLPGDAAARALAAITLPDGQIDFGGLDEAQQRAVITRLAQDPAARAAIRQRLPLAHAAPAQIQHNAAIVSQHYSSRHYAHQLQAIYRQLRDQPAQPTQPLEFHPSQRLLKAFLLPENFRLLRSE